MFNFVVIGAIAVAARGAPRSTFDFDLFTTDRRILQPSLWNELSGSGLEVDVRKGDVDDPLAGVVRTSDLILLKLDAGGPIDQRDVIQLLAVGPRDQLIAEVNEKIADLPGDAQALWQKIITELGQ